MITQKEIEEIIQSGEGYTTELKVCCLQSARVCTSCYKLLQDGTSWRELEQADITFIELKED